MTEQPDGIGPVKPKGGRPKKGAERAHIEARRAQVDRMELAGVSFRVMAEQLKVDVSTIRDDVKAVRERRRADAAGCDLQAERDKELARLELRVSQLSGPAAKGVASAHQQLTAIAARKAKLLGLDAPQQIAVSGEVRATLGTGLSPEQLADMLTDDVGLADDDLAGG